MSEKQPPDYATDLQASPKPAQAVPVVLQVIADLTKRAEMGVEKYGTPLQPFNGRDPLMDHYQELLDAVLYVRQELEERRAKGSRAIPVIPAELDRSKVLNVVRKLEKDFDLIVIGISEISALKKELIFAMETTAKTLCNLAEHFKRESGETKP